MHYSDYLLVFAAAIAAGAFNPVIGGGWFILFPGLIAAGLQPVAGNATTTTALWSGFTASVKVQGDSLGGRTRHYMLGIAIAGGVFGSLLLIVLTHGLFDLIGPYLLLFSWLLFTFYDLILRHLKWSSDPVGPFRYSHGKLLPLVVMSIYGSYFGAGLGMVITALLTFYGMRDPAAIEKVKNRFIIANNASAVGVFLCSGILSWPYVVASVSGAIIGGYFSQALGHRIDQPHFRRIMVIVGGAVTAYFVTRSFLPG